MRTHRHVTCRIYRGMDGDKGREGERGERKEEKHGERERERERERENARVGEREKDREREREREKGGGGGGGGGGKQTDRQTELIQLIAEESEEIKSCSGKKGREVAGKLIVLDNADWIRSTARQCYTSG